MPQYYPHIIVFFFAVLFVVACVSTPTPAHTVTVAVPTSPPPTVKPTAVPPTEISPERKDSMQIKITVENTELTATLIDSATTRDFVSLLPLTLTLEDYAGIEKISYLPRELSTPDVPAASDFTPGDLAYYAPWGNLAIHHHEFGYANGLVILGTIDGGKEALLVPGSVVVTIERNK
jgi:hypothetical protein